MSVLQLRVMAFSNGLTARESFENQRQKPQGYLLGIKSKTADTPQTHTLQILS